MQPEELVLLNGQEKMSWQIFLGAGPFTRKPGDQEKGGCVPGSYLTSAGSLL
jgi:hypothetical protein